MNMFNDLIINHEKNEIPVVDQNQYQIKNDIYPSYEILKS